MVLLLDKGSKDMFCTLGRCFFIVLFLAICAPNAAMSAEKMIAITDDASSGLDVVETSQSDDVIKMLPDSPMVVKLDADVANILIGNDLYLNIFPDSRRTLILMPLVPGATFFKALDEDGNLQNLSERFRAEHPNVHYSRNFLHPSRFKEGFDRAMLGISGLVDPFAYISHREDLLTLRNRLKGEIQVTQQIAERVGKVFGDKNNTPEELLEVYNFLTQALPESSISSDALRSTAVEVRDLISDFGQQLVDRKLLKKATYEKHKDKYLPQVYLKYMMDDQLVQVLSTGRKPSPQNYLKERKLNPEARAEDLLIMEILGHIKDPAFLANQSITTIGRDLAILRFLDEVAQNENWAVKNQFTGWSYWDEFDNVLEDMVAEERMNSQERQLIRRNLKLDQLPPKLDTGHHVDQLKPGQTYLKEYAKELQKQRRAEMKEPGFDPRFTTEPGILSSNRGLAH